MSPENYKELNKLLEQLCKERDALQEQIDRNALAIHERNSYTESILNSEGEDFKIFSPRTMKDLHKGEIERSDQEKSDYQQQNNELMRKRNKKDSMISVLQKVIREEDISRTSDPTEKEQLFSSGSMYDEMEQLIHKIELSKKFIDQDPDRAKMELELIKESLEKIVHHASCEKQ